MQHVRRVDAAAVEGAPVGERVVQKLVGAATGTDSCAVSWIRTPVGGGSPEGLHVHTVDQIFYILEGTMHVEVGGDVTATEPGSLVVFPAGEPHRNWNEGPAPTVHLVINAPAPDPGVPFAIPAG